MALYRARPSALLGQSANVPLSRRSLLAGTSAAAAGSLLLTGCGGKGNSTSKPGHLDEGLRSRRQVVDQDPALTMAATGAPYTTDSSQIRAAATGISPSRPFHASTIVS